MDIDGYKWMRYGYKWMENGPQYIHESTIYNYIRGASHCGCWVERSLDKLPLKRQGRNS
jgi:hypothetical protein